RTLRRHCTHALRRPLPDSFVVRPDMADIPPRPRCSAGLSRRRWLRSVGSLTRRIGGSMPKYLITGNYTSEGAKGVVAKGGSDRRAAVQKLAESVGGAVESFYFAFGGDDIVVIIEAPDNESVAAVTMTVGASGMVDIRTTVLVT